MVSCECIFCLWRIYALQLSSNPTLASFTEITGTGISVENDRKIDIWGDYLPGRALETHTQGLFFRFTDMEQENQSHLI